MQEALTTGGPRRTEPTIHASDPRFTYTPAAGTNIRDRFTKIDPNWPFGTLDPRVVEARRREAKRVLSDRIANADEALL